MNVLYCFQQGKEFLESHGMKVTDDDVKTRGQKEMLDQIVSSSDGQEEQNNNSENNNDDAESSEAQNEADAEVPANNGDSEADGPPKVTREGTMVITAKVCVRLMLSPVMYDVRMCMLT